MLSSQLQHLRAVLPDRAEGDVLECCFPLGGDVRDILFPWPMVELVDLDSLLLPVLEVIVDL